MIYQDFRRKYKKYKKEILSVADRIFRNGYFILGPELEKFEKNFAGYIGSKLAVGVNSGTDALYLALRAFGISKGGDEVITTSHTATATVSAIRMAGALPVFVDIDDKTLNIDAAKIEKAITQRTKCILPVHLYGYPAQMDKIMRIARKYSLAVVEDACQAHGASFNGKKVGSIGDVGCFSFYPTKNLGAFGDGGAIVTNNKAIADKVRLLRNYGEISKFNNDIEGINTRLDELQAGFLNWGLNKLDGWNKTREKLAITYRSHLKGLPLVLPPIGNKKEKRVWHLFVILTAQRDALKEFLAKRQIMTMIHYPRPVFAQKAYSFLGYKNKDLPVTGRAVKEIISLPLYPELTVKEVAFICDNIREFFHD